jgi:hypothetical protein
MQQSIRLGINNPCAESWDQMTPEKQGRFCGSCQKTVVDFTSMDDHELLQWFTRHQGSVCGRLRPDQLNRPVAAVKEKLHNRWRYWHYLIAGLLFSAEASAQINPADSARGRVVDANSHPISYASVMYGPKQGVATDANGYFAISMNKLSQHQILTISAIGYEMLHLNVDQLLTADHVHTSPIVIVEKEVIAGDVVITRVKRKRKPLADTISLFKDTLASIGLTRPALTAYPNPVARGGEITLKARLDQQGKYNIQLLTTTGALIATKDVDQANIALPIPANLVPGTYFIRLSHPALSKCYTQEIVVY